MTISPLSKARRSRGFAARITRAGTGTGTGAEEPAAGGAVDFETGDGVSCFFFSPPVLPSTRNPPMPTPAPRTTAASTPATMAPCRPFRSSVRGGNGSGCSVVFGSVRGVASRKCGAGIGEASDGRGAGPRTGPVLGAGGGAGFDGAAGGEDAAAPGVPDPAAGVGVPDAGASGCT